MKLDKKNNILVSQDKNILYSITYLILLDNTLFSSNNNHVLFNFIGVMYYSLPRALNKT